MPNKLKVDINYANSLIGSGADRATFINEISTKYNVTKQYASLLYYKLKPKLAAAASPPAQPTQQSVPVEVVSPSSVKIDKTVPNSEAIDLKKAYSKLFDEKTEDSKGEAAPDASSDGFQDEKTEIDESNSEPGVVDSSESEQEKNFRVRLGGLLKQIGVSLNNNLLWPERKLDSMEIGNIEEASNDIEMSVGSGLEGPYSPYYNYLIFTVLAPIVGRIDILPAKINSFIAWAKSISSKNTQATTPSNYNQPNQSNQQEQPKQEQRPATAANPQGYIYAGGLSPGQKMMVDKMIADGYQVEPGFNPNLPIDYEALQNKIARNKIIKI